MLLEKAEDLKLIKKKYKIPLYDHMTITIAITNDMQLGFKKITGQPREDPSVGLFFHSGGNDCWIILNTADLYGHTLDAGMIAHEALHATNYILEYIGMELTEQSEESYTYLLQWIVNESHKLLDKYKLEYAGE